MTKYPEPGDERIDSRDVIRAIADLEADRDALQAEVEDVREFWDDESYRSKLNEINKELLGEQLANAEGALADWHSEYGELLAALKALADQAEGYGDWQHGETLIREDTFVDYAEELAEDIGAIDPKAGWPLHCIDWEQAASELKMDYTSVEFGEHEYLMRA